MSNEYFRELPCIKLDWKSLNEKNFFEDIYIKFRETELAEISQLPRVWIHHYYACKNAEMNLKSTTTNGFNFLNGTLEGTLDRAWL